MMVRRAAECNQAFWCAVRQNAKSADKIQKFMLVIHAWPNLTDELICARIPDERTLKQFKLVFVISETDPPPPVVKKR